jgi:hypothetical protein
VSPRAGLRNKIILTEIDRRSGRLFSVKFHIFDFHFRVKQSSSVRSKLIWFSFYILGINVSDKGRFPFHTGLVYFCRNGFRVRTSIAGLLASV